MSFSMNRLPLVLCAVVAALDGALAQANVQDVKDYFRAVSGLIGNIPGCPDYNAIPDDIIRAGAQCTNDEQASLNAGDPLPSGGYSSTCSDACRLFYGYAGADCLRKETEFFERFGSNVQETLASGSVPEGQNRAFFLTLFNLALEEDYEFTDEAFDYLLDTENDYGIQAIESVAATLADDGVYVEDLIRTCQVPKVSSAASAVGTSNAFLAKAWISFLFVFYVWHVSGY
jgi:hypothetical protein